MILLSLQNVKKSFGTNEVLRDCSLTLQDGERMGLVGVNGSGKSTLMKIIAGLETADGGVITMQKGLRLGYLAQQGTVTPGNTVLEEMESVFAPVVAMEQKLRKLEQDMAECGSDEPLLRRLGSEYDSLTRRFEDSNGYGWKSAVQGVLAGLGFRKEQQSQKAELLSGGEKTRLCLGRMLLTNPDLLLLDEPTNHLDLESREALANALDKFGGTLLMVAHDRWLLSQVGCEAWELNKKGLTHYDNFAAYDQVRRAEAISTINAKNERAKPVVGETGAPVPMGNLSRDEQKRIKREEAEKRNALHKALKPLQARYDKLETKLNDVMTQQAELEQQLADPAIYADTSVSTELLRQFDTCRQESETLLEKLAAVEDEITKTRQKFTGE